MTKRNSPDDPSTVTPCSEKRQCLRSDSLTVTTGLRDLQVNAATTKAHLVGMFSALHSKNKKKSFVDSCPLVVRFVCSCRGVSEAECLIDVQGLRRSYETTVPEVLRKPQIYDLQRLKDEYRQITAVSDDTHYIVFETYIGYFRDFLAFANHCLRYEPSVKQHAYAILSQDGPLRRKDCDRLYDLVESFLSSHRVDREGSPLRTQTEMKALVKHWKVLAKIEKDAMELSNLKAAQRKKRACIKVQAYYRMHYVKRRVFAPLRAKAIKVVSICRMAHAIICKFRPLRREWNRQMTLFNVFQKEQNRLHTLVSDHYYKLISQHPVVATEEAWQEMGRLMHSMHCHEMSDKTPFQWVYNKRKQQCLKRLEFAESVRTAHVQPSLGAP